MGKRERFLRTYETQVLDALVLPPGLEEQYSLQYCLKDGELLLTAFRGMAPPCLTLGHWAQTKR